MLCAIALQFLSKWSFCHCKIESEMDIDCIVFPNTLCMCDGNSCLVSSHADMEAECSDDVMKLRVKFNDTFEGLVYSAGKKKAFLS